MTVVARHRITGRKIGDTIGAFLYIPNMIRSTEFSSSVTSPCQFLGAGPLYSREKNHTAEFSRFPSTIFGACKWTWIRVRWLLWDWRNICCGGYPQIEAGVNADHNSLIVFRIHYRRRAAPCCSRRFVSAQIHTHTHARTNTHTRAHKFI